MTRGVEELKGEGLIFEWKIYGGIKIETKIGGGRGIKIATQF